MSQDLWKSEANWFEEWFDSEAYHVLYRNRDLEEATDFINRVSSRFFQPQGKRLLDLGCGMGRHAVSLAKLGHEVVGIDLSERSISNAKEAHRKYEALSFVRADMRSLIDHVEKDSFDGILLLFTSFGYFEQDEDHQKVLKQIHQALRTGGHFLLDYFNVEAVQAKLTPHEFVERDGWSFEINRRIENGWVEKSIGYKNEQGFSKHALERVRSFSPDDLKSMCESIGFHDVELFGNYQLEGLLANSPRCILVARK